MGSSAAKGTAVASSVTASQYLRAGTTAPAHVLRFESIGTWPNTEVQFSFASLAGRDVDMADIFILLALGGPPGVIVS